MAKTLPATLAEYIASTPTAKESKPKIVYLVQVSPDLGDQIRVMFNIPAGTPDKQVGVYLLKYAAKGLETGYIAE